MRRWTFREFFFAWYDLWVGAYYDRKTRTLYVCPVPMLVFVFTRVEASS